MNSSSHDAANPSLPEGFDPIPLDEVNDGEGLSNYDLSPAAARTIDGICDEFERAWTQGSLVAPDLEDFWPLGRDRGLSKTAAHVLLKELLIIDLNYRQSKGLSDTLNLDDYIVRFPGCRDLVTDAFQVAGQDVSASFPSLASHETSRVPVETSSGFKMVSHPLAERDISHHLKSTINEIPQKLGSYTIEAELGQGGMGVVYRAFDNEMKRTVAIKVMKEDRIDSQEAVERFRREIRLLGHLSHENIVRAFHTLVDESTHTRYLVMEFVEGVELETLVGRLGRLPIPDACELIRRAALGLEHAHENGLIHRDLKPANLMLTSKGEVKVLDLGLARPQTVAEPDTGGRLTQEGQWLGTPYYMSPEQGIVQRKIDHRSDIYSLGCTLYKLLTGKTPFGNEEGATVLGILMQHANEPFPRLTELRPEVPAGLMRVIHQMVAKEPEKRLESAAQVASLLQPYCKGSDLEALHQAYSSGGLDDPAEPPPPRKWLRLAAGGILLLAILGVLAVVFFPSAEPQGSSVDLLAAIDLNRDPVLGEWELDSGVLKSPDRMPAACLRLPQTMPAEFDLKITARREDGVNLMFVNRSQETPFALTFSVGVTEVGRPGETAKTSPDHSPILQKGWAVKNFNSQTIVFRVRKEKLRIERDGQTLVERADYPALPEDLPGVPPNRLGFFIVAYDSEYEFSRILLTPVKAED